MNSALRIKRGFTLIRLSSLRNTPVIYQSKSIGLLLDAHLDLVNRCVSGISVGSGVCGRKTMLASGICSLTDEMILVRELIRMPARQNEKRLFVRDTTGLLIGCIMDYAIDEGDLSIAAIEVLPGLMRKDWKNKIWVYTFEENDGVMIPALFGVELTNQLEG